MKFETDSINIFGNILQIPLPKHIVPEVEKLLKAISEGKKLKGDMDIQRKKRSLSANAYCWVLCQKLAEYLSKDGSYHTKEDVYRTMIRDSQAPYGHMPVDNNPEEIDYVIKTYESHGLGWIAENMGPTRTMPGKVCIALYKGSSQYDTVEMARLINGLIEECKNRNIDVISDADKDLMLQEWGKQ